MKRRGFTLIELMVVIAIIIILAAIAIPNYLTMTARAKKSRVASDFASIATALETYRTDWGVYPTANAGETLVASNAVFKELSGGMTTAGTGTNAIGKFTAAGDAGPIAYITSNILTSMTNPYNTALYYHYGSLTANLGTHWLLWASETSGATDATPYLWRSDTTTVVSEISTAAPTIP